MKVKLTTDRVGPTGYYQAGEVLEVDRAEGEALLARGSAEPVEGEETAAAPRQERGRKGGQTK